MSGLPPVRLLEASYPAYRAERYLRPVVGTAAAASAPNAQTVRFRLWVDARVARRVARPEDAQNRQTDEAHHDRREWWVEEDLNLRPHAYQACALTT